MNIKNFLGGFTLLSILLVGISVGNNHFNLNALNRAEFQVPVDFNENPREMELERISGGPFISASIRPLEEN